jgi:hypothetical protein
MDFTRALTASKSFLSNWTTVWIISSRGGFEEWAGLSLPVSRYSTDTPRAEAMRHASSARGVILRFFQEEKENILHILSIGIVPLGIVSFTYSLRTTTGWGGFPNRTEIFGGK